MNKNQQRKRVARVPKKRRPRSLRNNNNGASAPLARSRRMAMSPPSIKSANGKTVIHHKEYLAEVQSAAAANTFAASSYIINPGLSSSFPWLSQIAPAYETYQFEDLCFTYEPSISAATSGVVALAVDYDVSDSDPTSKGDFMSNARAVRSACWQPSAFSTRQIDAAVMTKRRYVRAGAVPANNDPKSFDVGKLLVGTAGFGAGPINSGEMYVEYTVSFFTPQKDSSALASAKSAKVAGLSGVDKTHLFGTVAANVTGNLPVTAITNTMTFGVVGEYLVTTKCTGTGTNGATGAATGTNCTVSVLDAVNDSGTNSTFLFQYRVSVTVPGATVVFDNSGATTITAFTARVGLYAYANA